MLSIQQQNVLGQLLDTTVGRYASRGGDRALTYAMNGDILTLKFSTVVHWAAEKGLHAQVDRLAQEAVDVLDGRVKELKVRFKEITETPLSLEDLGGNDDLEIIYAQPQSPLKRAIYRRIHMLKVTN